jgi:cation transport regulator ChaC
MMISKSLEMLKYLTKREACQPRSLAIRLPDGRDVPALVYIYEGKNILDPTTPLAEMASMVVTAKGTSGACVDYIRRTFEGLSSIRLDDPEVTDLWEAVRTHPTATVVGC